MHQADDSPPPVAPSCSAESFQTLSDVARIVVPPTPTTYGWLAGSSTARAAPSGEPSPRQSVDPESPAAANTVCPWVAATANRPLSAEISDASLSRSHMPHEVEMTRSVSALMMVRYRSRTSVSPLFGA